MERKIIVRNGRSDREILTLLKKKLDFETEAAVSDLSNNEVAAYLYEILPDWIAEQHHSRVIWEEDKLYEYSD